MAKYATGTKSKAISDISGFEVRYTQLRTTWDNLRVEPEEFDPKHPQLTPAKNVTDATALYDPRPDNDPENVIIKIGAFGAGFDVSGVAGTGAIGNAIAEDQRDVSVSKATGTTTIGDFQTGAVITGVAGTGATGTETITHDRIFELPNGGASGTGGTGTESFDTSTGTLSSAAGTGVINNATVGSEPTATGVQATGVIGSFGEEGNGQLNLNVNGTGAVGTTNAGNEVAESELIESNTTGFGENEYGYGVWGGDNEVRGTGGVGTVSLDIFVGPTQSGVQATGEVGNVIFNQDISLTTGWGINGWNVNEFGGTDVSMGVEGTGGVGTSSFFAETALNVNGVVGTSAVGDENARINPGFGQGAWNDDTWGN